MGSHHLTTQAMAHAGALTLGSPRAPRVWPPDGDLLIPYYSLEIEAKEDIRHDLPRSRVMEVTLSGTLDVQAAALVGGSLVLGAGKELAGGTFLEAMEPEVMSLKEE